MSNNWNLHCADCGEECPADRINHGGDTLIAMARAARLMAAIKDNAQFADVWSIDLTINGRFVPLQWLWAHDGHRIVARDEYGTQERETSYECERAARQTIAGAGTPGDGASGAASR